MMERLFALDHFQLNASYFPSETKDLLPVDFLAKQGLVPLGIKTVKGLFGTKRFLNIGLLNPKRRKDVVRALEAWLKEKGAKGAPELAGFRLYHVDKQEFWDVMDKVYDYKVDKGRS